MATFGGEMDTNTSKLGALLDELSGKGEKCGTCLVAPRCVAIWDRHVANPIPDKKVGILKTIFKRLCNGQPASPGGAGTGGAR
jgi:hypothetical protein